MSDVLLTEISLINPFPPYGVASNPIRMT